MWQDRKHRFASRTLESLDGDPTQPDVDIMRVACEAPPAVTSGLMFELKAKGQEKSEYELDKRFTVSNWEGQSPRL
jgi:hypothetical protein